MVWYLDDYATLLLRFLSPSRVRSAIEDSWTEREEDATESVRQSALTGSSFLKLEKEFFKCIQQVRSIESRVECDAIVVVVARLEEVRLSSVVLESATLAP